MEGYGWEGKEEGEGLPGTGMALTTTREKNEDCE